MRSTYWLLLAAALCGCANHPSHTTEAPPAAAHNSTPAPAASSPLAASQPEANQDLLKQGYRQAVRRGETVYCRRQIVTGSRFTADVCLTEQQIKDRAQNAKDDLQTVGAGCVDGYCK
jgi:hypothetical protein